MAKNKRDVYRTEEEKIAVVKKKDNIITFKERWAYGNGSATQIIVQRLKKTKSGAVKIEGRFYDSPWYESMKELLSAIDWDFMRRNWEPDKRDFL
ncbi:MAG: hypothetical protein ACOZCO_05185 [Bacteroidota bacterium]